MVVSFRAIAALLVLLGLDRVHASFPCPGDCGDDGTVIVAELVTGVGIALGTSEAASCAPADVNGDGAVTVDELITAVTRALGRCFETVIPAAVGGATDVVYDSLGVPHIYGPDLDSVAYAQGYVHAAQRFWQMDTLRRAGEGRLSELLGFVTLEADVTMRTIFTTRDGRRLEEALWEHVQRTDPEIAAAIVAYTAGVNAWLDDLRGDRNGATLPPEYALLGLRAADLAPWRPQDSAAVGRTLQWELDGSTLVNDLIIPDLKEWFEAPAYNDIVRFEPFARVAVVSNPQPAAPPLAPAATAAPAPGVSGAVRRLLERAAGASPFGRRPPDAGSNNWVVAPSLSESGFAMLASDPHLGLSNPPVWFLQQLDAGGDAPLRVSGSALPGLPGILVGHNETGAWGITYTFFDVVDVYVETVTTPPAHPSEPRTVLFNGTQVPVLRLEEQFALNDGTVLTYPIEVVPHHGPMLPDPFLNDAVDGLAATGMTMRWTGQEVSDDFRAFFDLMRARDVDDFRAALRAGAQGANPNNFVWADVRGDIAYSSYARLPQRPPGTVPYAPMPGTGEAEWLTDPQGGLAWLPEDQFPQALNPPQGFIATANSDPTGHTFDNDPLNDGAYFAAWYANGLRQQRIHDLLSNRAGQRPAGARISVADMSAYQYDTASLDAQRLLPFLFAAAEARPELVDDRMGDALVRLRAWTVERPGSPACDAVMGIDAHELRPDIPPRAEPVSDEERADAVASSIYHAWIKQIWNALPPPPPQDWGDDWQNWGLPWRIVPHLLEDIDKTDPVSRVQTKGAHGDSLLWDDPDTGTVETRTDALLGALARALGVLERRFGSADMDAWLWGRIHHVRFLHVFGQIADPNRDLGPIPAPGGFFTVNPAAPPGPEDNFIFYGGASQRLVVVLDPAGVRAVNVLAGGQNGNPGSTSDFNRIQPEIHYGDQVPHWVNGGTFSLRFTRAEVSADNRRQVRFAPPP